VAENALQTFETLVNVTPSIAFGKRSDGTWKKLHVLLSTETGAKLLGVYFTHLASSSAKAGKGLPALPLTGSGGLQLTGDDMLQICRGSLQLLVKSSDNPSEVLLTQTVRNLVFLGRCFAVNGLKRRTSGLEHDPEEDNDLSAIEYLFGRLSYAIRQENISTVSRSAAIDCQAALVSTIDAVPNISTVLRPLYTLTDPSVPNRESVLADKARELLDLLQKKLGKDAYIKALSAVQVEAKERRNDRRTKRRIEVATVPGKRRKLRQSL